MLSEKLAVTGQLRRVLFKTSEIYFSFKLINNWYTLKNSSSKHNTYTRFEITLWINNH
jgi:hypothetical protein